MSDELVMESSPRLAPSANDIPEDVDRSEMLLQNEFAKIPDKMAFKIGEVADITGVKSYILRYWETEFDPLKPQKSKNNQRIYTRKDVEMVFLIKKLLYADRFSIEGARAALKKQKKDIKKVRTLSNVNQYIEDLRDRAFELNFRIETVQRLFQIDNR